MSTIKIAAEIIAKKVKSLPSIIFSTLSSISSGCLERGATLATSRSPENESKTSHLADLKLVKERPDLADLKLRHLEENLPADAKEPKED